jgi:hypothetical protein
MNARWGRPVAVDRKGYPVFLADNPGEKGACVTWPYPDDFTVEYRRNGGAEAQDRAKAVCALCPFRVPCLEWAERTNQEGVYGGTTTAERIRRRRETKDNRMAVLA